MLILKLVIIPILVFLANCKSASSADEDNGNVTSQESKNEGTYTVKLAGFGSKLKTAGDHDHDALYRNLIPEGCYGQKQLLDMLRKGQSRIKYKPHKPEWCTEDGFLIPTELKGSPPASSKAPFEIRVYPFTKSDVFRVVIKSTNESTSFETATLAAKAVNEQGQIVPKNRGRFIQSEGVTLLCCSYYDKDVALYKSEEATQHAVLYWVHEENTEEDFEGFFLFQATVAQNSTQYWVDITSDIYKVEDTSTDEMTEDKK